MPQETCQKLFAEGVPDSPGDGAADDPPEQPPGDCSPSPDHQDALQQPHETPKDERHDRQRETHAPEFLGTKNQRLPTGKQGRGAVGEKIGVHKEEPQDAREQPPARLCNEAAQEQPLAECDEEEGRSQVAPDKKPVERDVRVGNEAEKEGTYYSPKSGQYYPEQPCHQTWRSPEGVLLFIQHGDNLVENLVGLASFHASPTRFFLIPSFWAVATLLYDQVDPTAAGSVQVVCTRPAQ
jgi:hypothetical protein